MRFYSIQHSLNKKIMGNYPQIKEVRYHCDVDHEPLFIGNFHFEEIKVNPIVANPILHPKSKLTDLIYLWNVGFSFTKLISGKLKSIIERHRNTGLQFIQCSVYKDNIEHKDYWLLNMFEFNNEYIDFNNSNIYFRKHNQNRTENFEIIKFNSLESFNDQIKINDIFDEFYLYNIGIKNNVKDSFFQLKNGVKYVVSENLKKEIEDSGCTGIEFQPTELSLNEWLLPNGERERIYGKT